MHLLMNFLYLFELSLISYITYTDYMACYHLLVFVQQLVNQLLFLSVLYK